MLDSPDALRQLCFWRRLFMEKCVKGGISDAHRQLCLLIFKKFLLLEASTVLKAPRVAIPSDLVSRCGVAMPSNLCL